MSGLLGSALSNLRDSLPTMTLPELRLPELSSRSKMVLVAAAVGAAVLLARRRRRAGSWSDPERVSNPSGRSPGGRLRCGF